MIFLDPPYGGVILENALKQIETFDILSVNGIIICESAVEDRFSHGFAVVRGTPLRRYHDYHSAAAEWRNGMK